MSSDAHSDLLKLVAKASQEKSYGAIDSQAVIETDKVAKVDLISRA